MALLMGRSLGGTKESGTLYMLGAWPGDSFWSGCVIGTAMARLASDLRRSSSSRAAASFFTCLSVFLALWRARKSPAPVPVWICNGSICVRTRDLDC